MVEHEKAFKMGVNKTALKSPSGLMKIVALVSELKILTTTVGPAYRGHGYKVFLT